MKLCIPTIGSKIVLLKPWTFTVWSERRNVSLGNALKLIEKRRTGPWPQLDYNFRPPKPLPPIYSEATLWKGQQTPTPEDRYCGYEVVPSSLCVLPKGTVLTIDRIYIRKGDADMKNFDSVSFRINVDPKNPKTFGGDQAKFIIPKGIRFWAKLPEVNKIEFDFTE